MECDRCEEDIVGFCVSCDLVLFPIFRDDTDFALERDLTDDLVDDFSIWIDESFELASLHEE